MVMAVKIAYHQPSNNLLVLAGYEGGYTAVHVFHPPISGQPSASSSQPIQLAQAVYLSQPHTQPVLSIDAAPDNSVYYTSSADAIIAAHRIPDLPFNSRGTEEQRQTETFQDMTRVTDGKTQNDTKGSNEKDSKAPTSESSLSKEPAPDSTDSSPLSFAKQALPKTTTPSTSRTSKPSGLSSLLSTSTAPSTAMPPTPSAPRPLAISQPYKFINTKHSGQQSLHVRSDGRIFLTGGWDSKIRIYSTKTLKEVAVLKWHKEGVYAAAFGAILNDTDIDVGKETQAGDEKAITLEFSGAPTGLSKLQKQREVQIQSKHWVVAGAKDGKVSLWEVF